MMLKKSSSSKAQALSEFISITFVLMIFLFATYIFGKMIHIKTTTSVLNRQNAFMNTFKNIEQDKIAFISPDNEFIASYTRKSNSLSEKSMEMPSFMNKIFNFINKTKQFDSYAKSNLKSNICKILGLKSDSLAFKDSIYLNVDSFDENTKYKLLLYSTALLLAGEPVDTDISSIGSGLLETADPVIEKEHLYFE